MNFPIDEINAINAACYDHNADRWLRFPFEEFLPNWVATYSKQKENALDIGSGNGSLAAWLQEKGLKVLCLDPSSEMVRRCRQKGLKTIQTTIQDFETKESFSSIFAICSLIHVPKKEFPRTIEKIATLLSFEGVLYLAMIEGEKEEVLVDDTGYPRFFATYQKGEILSLLEGKFSLLAYQKTLKVAKEGRGDIEYLVFAFKKRPQAERGSFRAL